MIVKFLQPTSPITDFEKDRAKDGALIEGSHHDHGEYGDRQEFGDGHEVVG